MNVVAKIDDYGMAAWIALMVLSFIIFWPAGLVILGYLLWSGRMGMGCSRGAARWQYWQHKGWRRGGGRGGWGDGPSSGNTAFDEYRAETLKRLEDEQREFFDFLDRLRQAKDKAEFDQFMADRRNRPAPDNGTPDAEPAR